MSRPGAGEEEPRTPSSNAKAEGYIPPRLRRGLIAVIVAAGLVSAVNLGVYWFLPVQRYAQGFIRAVYGATGARLAFRGKPHLSLFPRPTLRLRDITITATPGIALPPLIEATSMHVQLTPDALLRGELAVAHVVIYDPIITFAVAPGGVNNWNLSDPATDAYAFFPGEDRGGTGTHAAATLSRGYRFEDVRIVNGSVSYTRLGRGDRRALAPVNGRVFVPALNGPLAAQVYFPWRGDLVQCDVKLASMQRLLQDEETRLTLEASTGAGDVTYTGTVQRGDSVRAHGRLQLRARSWRDLATGGAPDTKAATGEPGPMTADGTLDIADGMLRVTDTRVTVSDLRLGGDFAVRLGHDRPEVGVRLATDVVDLSRLLPAPVSEADPDALRDTAAYLQAPAWSDEPIDLAGLAAADMDIEVYSDVLRLRGLETGPNHMTGTVRDGDLTLTVADALLGDGTLRTRIRVDRSGDIPTYDATLFLDSVEAGTLLNGLWGAAAVTGSTDGVVRVVSAGTSPHEIMACLQGWGALTVTDGTLRGVDLAGSSGNVMRFVLRQVTGVERRTTFEQMAGTFEIRDGILHTRDFRLRATALDLEGGGATNLLTRGLSGRLMLRRPWMSVPITLDGTWADLDVRTGVPRPLPFMRGRRKPIRIPDQVP